MKLSQLEQIIEVATTGTISQAAINLYVTQPSLSLSIKKAEDELGTKLFERNSTGMILTPLGNEFVDRAKEILEQVDALSDACRSNKMVIPLELSLASIGHRVIDIEVANLLKKYGQNFMKINMIDHAGIKLLDCVAPAVMIGQIIGRWGNFVNAEAHGGITNLPWRMGIAPYHEGLPFSQEYMVYYHPTFLYESLWNTLGFLIAHFVVTKRKKTDGNVTFFYFAWYGLGRGFIELLRTDSLRIFGMKVSALVGFSCAIIFGMLFIKNVRREKNGYNT